MTVNAVGTEFLVNTATANEQGFPAAAALSNGGFVVTWTDWSKTKGDTSSNAVHGQVFDAGGAKVGAEFLVNTTTNSYQMASTVTATPGGGFFVVWTDASSGDKLRGQLFSASGAAVGNELLVSDEYVPVGGYHRTDQFSSLPHVAALANGGFAVTWADERIRGQILDSSGARVGSAFSSTAATGASFSDATVAALPGGGFVVASTTSTLVPSTTLSAGGSAAWTLGVWEVRGQIFTANGAATGADFLISTSSQAGSPSIAPLANGGFVVAWQGGSQSDILGQAFDATGTKIGTEFLVNTTTAGSQSLPSVTGLSGGGFLIMWKDDSQTGADTSGGAVRGQMYNAAGLKAGNEFVVNTTTSGFQGYPAVAALTGERIAVAWYDNSQTGGDTSSGAIRGQLFTTAAIDPSRRILVHDGAQGRELQMDAYVGPVSWLKNQYLGLSTGEAAIGSSDADFMNLQGGDDAAEGREGDDVLDGGTGSNFLTGGSGADTFFVDGRNSETTWSTVTDFEAGEWATAWGWRQSTSTLTWADMQGADGYKGATAHIDLDANGSIDMSMTFTGKAVGAVITMPGQVGSDAYLAFRLS